MVSEPFNEHNTAPVVDGGHKAAIVPLNIKDHPVTPYDAGASIRKCGTKVKEPAPCVLRGRPARWGVGILPTAGETPALREQLSTL